MPDDPDYGYPDDAPTPPRGVPVSPPDYPSPSEPLPNGENGGYPRQPYPGPGGGGYDGQPGGYTGTPQGQSPSYLDTPAPGPVVSKAEVEKPPADFDG